MAMVVENIYTKEMGRCSKAGLITLENRCTGLRIVSWLNGLWARICLSRKEGVFCFSFLSSAFPPSVLQGPPRLERVESTRKGD